MEKILTNDPVIFQKYADECLSGHEGMVVCVHNDSCVWTGQLPTFDKDVCEQENLFVGKGRYLGGSIVNMPGDVSVCLTTWGISDFAPQTIDACVEALKKYGNVSTDENDVLLDGKKVVSWARATIKSGWCQSVIHFSVGEMNLNLVKRVCRKEMGKTPGSLSNYGIASKEILLWIGWDQ